MKWLSLVILIISCTDSFALSCITIGDKTSLTEPLKDFHLNKFIEKIRNLESIPNADADLCRVELYINYFDRQLTVKFTAQLKSSELKDQQIQIDTYIEGSNAENVGVLHFVEYACSDDECERNFIYQHIRWLLDADHPELVNALVLWIFFDNKQSEKCYDNTGTSKECSSGQCLLSVRANQDEEPMVGQTCADDQNRSDPGLYFTTVFNSHLQFISIDLEYRCNYDECNNQTLAENVVEIFYNTYNSTEVFKRFAYKNETQIEIENMTSDSIQPSTLSSTQQKTTSFKSTSIIDVSTTTSTTISTSTNTTTTATEINAGHHQQNSNSIIYTILITFIFRLIFLV